MTTACVSNIQKFCVHDGPGIRSVVFLMGCPLRCKWCQNPENFAAKPVLMFNQSRCIGCGECLRHCSQGCGVEVYDGALAVDRAACTGCGDCVEHCYVEAKTLCGQKMTTEEVYQAVMKDEMFYRETGGGITISGGEATMYPDFCSELLQELQQAGIHTAVETCGYCSEDSLRTIAAHTDLFLYDLKAATPETHVYWTGVDCERIHNNLRMLVQNGSRVILRIPLIPGVNDGDEFHRIMQLATSMNTIPEMHILPFHQVGSSKYEQVGADYDMVEVPECPQSLAEQHKEIALSYGFEVNIGGWDCR